MIDPEFAAKRKSKATAMMLSEKRQSVFPPDWCERVSLARGGPANVFDLGVTVCSSGP
jgi:hypothetical protein